MDLPVERAREFHDLSVKVTEGRTQLSRIQPDERVERDAAGPASAIAHPATICGFVATGGRCRALLFSALAVNQLSAKTDFLQNGSPIGTRTGAHFVNSRQVEN